MTTQTIKPGDEFYELDRHNNVKKRVATYVSTKGVFVEGYPYPVTWGTVFATEKDAYVGMVARAERAVEDAAKELEHAKGWLRQTHIKIKALKKSAAVG